MAVELGRQQLWRLESARDDITPYASFRPGQEWLDSDGEVIQAHGGQVVPSKDADGRTIYYLYGEDRTNGYHSAPGVHVYSSYDLYNWDDRGVALRALSSKDQFEDDPYFEALYGDYSAAQQDAVYRDLGTVPVDGVTPPIIERPKVIFNEKTGKWVMWAHMDGPSATSSAQYAKANAGVAVADSPFGPFKYIDSYRLHYAPADAGTDQPRPEQPWHGARHEPVRRRRRHRLHHLFERGERDHVHLQARRTTTPTWRLPPMRAGWLGRGLQPHLREPVEGIPGDLQARRAVLPDHLGHHGWSPNPSRWASSSDIMGAWTEMGDPFPWWAQSNSWNSQPSSVIPVDREHGKYIYMGDRWNGGGDLKNAQMVWLPINMGEGGDSLAVEVHDEWTLDQLDQWSAWDCLGRARGRCRSGAHSTHRWSRHPERRDDRGSP